MHNIMIVMMLIIMQTFIYICIFVVGYHISGIVHEIKLSRYVDCYSVHEKTFTNLVI